MLPLICEGRAVSRVSLAFPQSRRAAHSLSCGPHPGPKFRNLKPETRNPKSEIRNPKTENRKPKTEILVQVGLTIFALRRKQPAERVSFLKEVSAEIRNPGPRPGPLCSNRNPEPATRTPEPETRKPEAEPRKSKFGTRNQKPGTRNLEPGIRTLETETQNPKPGTRNPKKNSPHTQAFRDKKISVWFSHGGSLAR